MLFGSGVGLIAVCALLSGLAKSQVSNRSHLGPQVSFVLSFFCSSVLPIEQEALPIAS